MKKNQSPDYRPGTSDSGSRTFLPGSQNIVIIKYNAGNIRSVDNALHRLGYEAVFLRFSHPVY